MPDDNFILNQFSFSFCQGGELLDNLAPSGNNLLLSLSAVAVVAVAEKNLGDHKNVNERRTCRRAISMLSGGGHC